MIFTSTVWEKVESRPYWGPRSYVVADAEVHGGCSTVRNKRQEEKEIHRAIGQLRYDRQKGLEKTADRTQFCFSNNIEPWPCQHHTPREPLRHQPSPSTTSGTDRYSVYHNLLRVKLCIIKRSSRHPLGPVYTPFTLQPPI